MIGKGEAEDVSNVTKYIYIYIMYNRARNIGYIDCQAYRDMKDLGMDWDLYSKFSKVILCLVY